jgi:hypothetical protein
MVGWILADTMIKIALNQGKLVSRSPFPVNDFGLEKRNNMVRLSLVSGSTPGKGLRALW